MDLFTSAAQDELRSLGPLAARLRPRGIDDIIGQENLLGLGGPLRRLVESDRLQSIILWGPPGTGKTSIALAVSSSTSSNFVQLSAVSAGVKEVREVIDSAKFRLGSEGRRTILFLDEIHRFSKNQQDALLPAVEEGSIVLIGATTENPSFQVNAALLSRSVLFRLEPLTAANIEKLIERACEVLNCRITNDARDEVVRQSRGDARRALGLLDLASVLGDGAAVSIDDVEKASGTIALRYGVDDHYDIVSAFIKSMRGSDPQASILYLARMLSSGVDPRFIARRMIIFASEDVGLADPTALTTAVNAAQALEFVGMPEAQLNLAQAAIHLATAPKSNATSQAIWTARREIEEGIRVEIPPHLRDAHYHGAQSLGHGEGYVNPHDHPGIATSQPYLPENLTGSIWYVPSNAGFESVIRSRMGTVPSDNEGRMASEDREVEQG
ncbi:MAG: replication-associated recombination protein A [Actinomycetota bacterium]